MIDELRADDDGMPRGERRRDAEARKAYNDLKLLGECFHLRDYELPSDLRHFYTGIISAFRNDYPGRPFDIEFFILYAADKVDAMRADNQRDDSE